MIESRWLMVVLVWLIVIVVGGILWNRFTRVPAQTGGVGLRAATSTRRVLPLWLVLVLLILFGTAMWLTVRWVAP